MTSLEAAKILEIAPDSTPGQIEARFQEVRRKLEEKIAKAPTPGLQAKYRESLEEITTAFEILTLAADSTTLPVLQRSSPAATSKSAEQGGAKVMGSNVASKPPTASNAKPNGNKEFVYVAIIGFAILLAGGWWVIKTRAEAAEKARIEIEARAEADRKAAEAKAEVERKAAESKMTEEKEKVRQETMLAQLLAGEAEAKVRWEEVEKELAAAERRLSELKSDLRNTRDVPAPQLAELQAQYAAQSDYVEWLQPYVARNPLRTNLAKLAALLSAKSVEAASSLAAEVSKSLSTSEQQLTEERKSRLAVTTSVQITSEPDGLPYLYTDAYGRTVKGMTPFKGELPLGSLVAEVQPPEGWAKYQKTVFLKRGQPLKFDAVFAEGNLVVESDPSGADVYVGGKYLGGTPLSLQNRPTGSYELQLLKPHYRPAKFSMDVVKGQTAHRSVSLEPGAGFWQPDFTKGPRKFRMTRQDTAKNFSSAGATPVTREVVSVIELSSPDPEGYFNAYTEQYLTSNSSNAITAGTVYSATRARDGKWSGKVIQGGIRVESGEIVKQDSDRRYLTWLPIIRNSDFLKWPPRGTTTGTTWDIPVEQTQWAGNTTGKATGKLMSIEQVGDAEVAVIEFDRDLRFVSQSVTGATTAWSTKSTTAIWLDLTHNYIRGLVVDYTTRYESEPGSPTGGHREIVAVPLP